MYKCLLIDWSSVRSIPREFIKTTPYRFSRGVVLGIFNSGTPWEPIISINTNFFSQLTYQLSSGIGIICFTKTSPLTLNISLIKGAISVDCES